MTDPWFLCREERPRAEVRLFCLPFAGSGASVYHSWSRALPPSIEVRAVQLPGRETRLREPLQSSAATLARMLADALGPSLDRRFALFGHSMGALLSFETARELRRRGARMPDRLFVSGKSAPQLPLSRPPVFELPDGKFLNELRRLYDPPQDAWNVPDLLELLLPIMRADMGICDTYVYRPEPPLGCPIVAFGGVTDLEAPPPALDAWRDQTTSAFSRHSFPGGHFYIHGALPDVQRVVASELAPPADGGRTGETPAANR